MPPTEGVCVCVCVRVRVCVCVFIKYYQMSIGPHQVAMISTHARGTLQVCWWSTN